MTDILLLCVTLGAYVLLHGATIVIAVMIYRAQKVFFTEQEARFKSAIANVEQKMAQQPDYRRSIDEISLQIERNSVSKAEIEAIIKANAPEIPDIEAIIKANPPSLDLEAIEEQLSTRVCKAINGKLGAEVRQLKEDMINDPQATEQMIQLVDQAKPGGGTLLERLIMNMAERYL